MSGDYLPERTTYDFAPETPRQRQNRARLAAIMAQQKPAIEAPKGCFDLTDAGIKARKPDKEIFEMSTKNGNGAVVMTGLPEAATDAGVGFGDMGKAIEVMTPRPSAAPAPAAAAPPQERKQRRGHARQIPEELVRAMHARYTELGNLSQTAKEYGRNASYLGQQFKAHGLPVKGVGDRRSRGKGQKPAATKPRAAKPAALPSPPSDEVVRQIHADWLLTGGELLPVAMRYRYDQGILRKRFKELGLAYPRRQLTDPLPLPVVDLREPYEPPTVTAVPLSKPFAGQIEKVTIHNATLTDAAIAAAFKEGVGVADDVGAQTSEPALLPRVVLADAAHDALRIHEPGVTAVRKSPGMLPANIRALLADMEALGGQVQVSGEINIRIVFGEEARP